MWARCSAGSALDPAISGRPSVPVFTVAATTVGPEVRTQFESQFEYGSKLFREVEESDPVREKYPLLFLTARAPGHSELPKKIFLDLVEANRRQLLAAGVAAKNISASPLCTSCRTDLLFSYRAEKGVTGRMMAVAGIRP